MKLLNNENGNMTLFIVGFFSAFFFLFLIILSFANVFVEKELASNNAEQASIVASGILLDHLEDAIEDYDNWLRPLLLLDPIPSYVIGLHLLEDDVQSAINSQPSSLSYLEKRHKAINQVLKSELPGNSLLRGFVVSNLNQAKPKIKDQVKKNIEDNNGELFETKVVFNHNHRIEVETATKYKSFLFDDYFTENERYVKQTGYGPKFEFAESLYGWSLNFSY
ncbi:hypothetical protein [Ureibacillus thermosphaericus]|uniref:hypothetical protein n=1 Tax=Ureibacillus thermosphaericus TaxID=51173 RepID=UPI0030C99C4D